MSSPLLPTSRPVHRSQASLMHSVQRLAVRTLVILVVAGVVVGAATAIGYSPLAANLPGSFLPLGGEQRAGGPPPGAGGERAPGAAGQAATAAPAARGPQAARTAGQPPDVGSQPFAGAGQGLLGGRNAPSLSRGLPEEVRYLVVFAILTAMVALTLRVVRPRRRRRTNSPAAAGA